MKFVSRCRYGGFYLFDLDHRSAADFPYADPFPADVHDAIRTSADRLHFLRQALGLQSTPTNQTVIGLSLVLTFFLMQPVGTKIYTQAVETTPGRTDQCNGRGAARDWSTPSVHGALCSGKRRGRSLWISPRTAAARYHDLSMRVLVPAYILSELKAGFQIGTILFSFHGD